LQLIEVRGQVVEQATRDRGTTPGAGRENGRRLISLDPLTHVDRDDGLV
jgi:hypothetical protein